MTYIDYRIVRDLCKLKSIAYRIITKKMKVGYSLGFNFCIKNIYSKNKAIEYINNFHNNYQAEKKLGYEKGILKPLKLDFII